MRLQNFCWLVEKNYFVALILSFWPRNYFLDKDHVVNSIMAQIRKKMRKMGSQKKEDKKEFEWEIKQRNGRRSNKTKLNPFVHFGLMLFRKKGKSIEMQRTIQSKFLFHGLSLFFFYLSSLSGPFVGGCQFSFFFLFSFFSYSQFLCACTKFYNIRFCFTSLMIFRHSFMQFYICIRKKKQRKKTNTHTYGLTWKKGYISLPNFLDRKKNCKFHV